MAQKLSKTTAERIASLVNTITVARLMLEHPVEPMTRGYRALWNTSGYRANRSLIEEFGIHIPGAIFTMHTFAECMAE